MTGVSLNTELKRRGCALDVGGPVEYVERVGTRRADYKREMPVVFPAAVDGTASTARNFQEEPTGSEAGSDDNACGGSNTTLQRAACRTPHRSARKCPCLEEVRLRQCTLCS